MGEGCVIVLVNARNKRCQGEAGAGEKPAERSVKATGGIIALRKMWQFFRGSAG